MNRLKSFVMIFIAVTAILNFSLTVSAKTYNADNLSVTYDMEEEEQFPCERTNYKNDPIWPIGFTDGDELGYTGWSSLAAAKAHYGVDFSYHYCGGGGSPYNYYYCFDDGSKMFFGVRY